jgi:hypothetical protein
VELLRIHVLIPLPVALPPHRAQQAEQLRLPVLVPAQPHPVQPRQAPLRVRRPQREPQLIQRLHLQLQWAARTEVLGSPPLGTTLPGLLQILGFLLQMLLPLPRQLP